MCLCGMVRTSGLSIILVLIGDFLESELAIEPLERKMHTMRFCGDELDWGKV